jgi:hypothetical protein
MACAKVLVQREGEKTNSYNKRRCCNTICAGIASHMGRPARDSICRFCGNLRALRPDGYRFATCGTKACVAAARDSSNTLIHWPIITGEINWRNAFAKHNRDPGDGGRFTMMRPETHVMTMSASALAVQDGPAG